MSDHHAHAGRPASVDEQLCLEFANTAEAHASDNPVERLTSYQALISWGREVKALAPQEAERVELAATHSPSEADISLRRAIELREAIYRLFLAVAEASPPQASDLDILNAKLAEAHVRRHIVYTPEGFQWEWLPEAVSLDMLLWHVALSAGELLNSDRLLRVKRCANETCGWLFVDTTRNDSRRWCSMGDCGNRAKARRFYRRSRAAKVEDDQSD